MEEAVHSQVQYVPTMGANVPFGMPTPSRDSVESSLVSIFVIRDLEFAILFYIVAVCPGLGLGCGTI